MKYYGNIINIFSIYIHIIHKNITNLRGDIFIEAS
jgi:hypothetical protein